MSKKGARLITKLISEVSSAEIRYEKKKKRVGRVERNFPWRRGTGR